MKLFVPEPDIKLYTDGFEKHDKLNRKDQGINLSNLVENISDSMVIALNGEWGSGKSVFLKCWVGEHTNSDTYKSRPIYFDAFEHDFMADPLIALVSVLDEQIKKDNEKKDNQLIKTSWKAAKNVAPKLARFGARTTLAAMTAGASEFTGDVGGITGAVSDALLQVAKDSADKAIDQFWASENSKRAAIQEFRNALTKMAEEQKLVIVIDELDRCRPDFALSMLEIIKHLFNVPNVHFIFGINLDAMQGMIQKRYGQCYDSNLYLHKFFTMSWTLSLEKEALTRYSGQSQFSQYVISQATKLELEKDQADTLTFLLSAASNHKHLNLRSVDRIISDARLFDVLHKSHYESVKFMSIACLIIRHIEPEFLTRIGQDENAFNHLLKIFNCEPSLADNNKVEFNDDRPQGLYDIFSFFTFPDRFENLGKHNWYPRDVEQEAKVGDYYHGFEFFKRNILQPIQHLPNLNFD